MTWKQTFLAAILVLAVILPVRAALEYRTSNGDTLGGTVLMILNAAGVPVPVSSSQGIPQGSGTYLNGSAALTTASSQIFAATSRMRIKLVNISGIGAAGTAVVIWCRWGSAAVAGGTGSFALASNGGGIDDQGQGVNQSSLNCIAESGTPKIYAEQY